MKDVRTPISTARGTCGAHAREFIIISVEFMVWINCGLDNCGLDEGVKVANG